MIPADTDVTCPVCDTEFTIKKEIYEGQTIECDNCDATLTLVDGDLEEVDEDIYDEEDEKSDKERKL